MVVGVGLDYFFRDESKRVLSIVRRAERQRFPDQPDGETVSYFFETLYFNASEPKLNAYEADFQPVDAEAAANHVHERYEFLHVTAGRLAMVVGRQEVELGERDSIYFDSSVPHSYRRLGRNRCTALVVTTT